MVTNLVGQPAWDAYKAIMRDAHETFAQKQIVWRKSLGALDQNGEDNKTERFSNITLKVLLQYNAFRTWPVTRTMDIGEQDKESTAILINKQYLSELGYINGSGNFTFDPAADKFIIDNFIHKCMGDTFTSQGYDDPLWIMIIVKKEELLTGDPVIP